MGCSFERLAQGKLIGLATTCEVFTNRWWNCFPRFHSDFHCLRGPWVIFIGIRTNKVLNSVEKSLYRFRWSWSCTCCRHSGFCPLSRRGRYRHQGWLLLLCCTPDHKSYQSVHRQHKHHCHHCHHCHHFHPYHQFLIIITVSAPLFSNSRVASKAPSGPTSSAPDNQDEDQENEEEEENDDVRTDLPQRTPRLWPSTQHCTGKDRFRRSWWGSQIPKIDQTLFRLFVVYKYRPEGWGWLRQFGSPESGKVKDPPDSVSHKFEHWSDHLWDNGCVTARFHLLVQVVCYQRAVVFVWLGTTGTG